MTLHELARHLDGYLQLSRFPHDDSRNGIQVSNSAPDTKAIKTVALGVDASRETILRAAAAGADLLVVHHGLLWGACEGITGIHYGRIKALLDADLALYACHLPLDAHREVGNNYGMAARLALSHLEPFGEYHDDKIGVMGLSEEGMTVDALLSRLFPGYEDDCRVYAFGKTLCKKIAIVSGGAGNLMDEAAAAGADVYVTGEILHQHYHRIGENALTVIAAGHYRSETVGPLLLAEKLHTDLALETRFIDVPTGL